MMIAGTTLLVAIGVFFVIRMTLGFWRVGLDSLFSIIRFVVDLVGGLLG